MTIKNTDRKQAICALFNAPNGGVVLAQAYSGYPDIPSFLAICDMVDGHCQRIQTDTIQDVLKYVGNPKFWVNTYKEKINSAYSPYDSPPNSKWYCEFSCKPFVKDLRACVWDDNEKIIKIDLLRVT